MHVYGHTEKECRPKGRYHFESAHFKESLKDDVPDFDQVNTEVCEQTFYHFGKYKHIAKHFNRFQFWFYMYVVIHMHNERVQRRTFLNFKKQQQNKLNEKLNKLDKTRLECDEC